MALGDPHPVHANGFGQINLGKHVVKRILLGFALNVITLHVESEMHVPSFTCAINRLPCCKHLECASKSQA